VNVSESLNVSECQWVSVTDSESVTQWESVHVSECPRLSVSVSECQWVTASISECQRVSVSQWVSVSVKKERGRVCDVHLAFIWRAFAECMTLPYTSKRFPAHICIPIYIFLCIICKYVTTYKIASCMGKDPWTLVLVTTTCQWNVHARCRALSSYNKLGVVRCLESLYRTFSSYTNDI
jgi:hypothetical protein